MGDRTLLAPVARPQHLKLDDISEAMPSAALIVVTPDRAPTLICVDDDLRSS